MQVIRKISE